MANSEYMFLLLSIIVYYMTKIYIFSFLSDITLPVWKQLTILALALFFNQFPYLSPLLIDPLLFLVVLRQETKQLFSLKALFLAVAPSVLVYYVDIFVILGFTDPFLHFHHSLFVPTPYKLLFLMFILLLVYLLSYFNHSSKEYLKNELRREQQAYMTNLEIYGKHLEKLYRDVRAFQSDYLSRIERLGQAIKSESITQIQDIYAQTVHEANDYWDDKHYNISKLRKINISSIKSLLSAKIISAEKSGIDLNVEVPDNIKETYIPELDLLLLMSIFCDNAIEAALEAQQPHMSIAYFLLDDYQMFVVTNTTKKKVDINKIFEEGYSSKGSERGIGLSNAQRILKKYPYLSLRTKSFDKEFSQTLTMPKEEVDR
ncbi:TPA: GHKL domain-containing protein [Streptococcus pyogenes]